VTYRIHFTSQDLARTRVASVPMPLLELSFAARALKDRSQPVRLDQWRRHSGTRLSPEARLALSLIPSVGYSPSFVAPPGEGPPEELLESVRATPRSEIAAQLAELADYRQPIPSWARHLADDADLYRRLSDSVSSLYADLVGPYWRRLSDLLTADRTLRMRQLLSGGVESLLSQANPRWMRWNPPVLEIRMANGVDHDLVLRGQGVLLVPSAFCNRTLVDDSGVGPPTVSYPPGLTDQPLERLAVFSPEQPTPSSATAVSVLLGNTRSAVLDTNAEHPGCSTKELARLAGVAPASASEHATVLREAGLVQTVRHRNLAIHSVTALGTALLNAPYDRSRV
jgi:DNA-binding transcriptional ArsR family regulator